MDCGWYTQEAFGLFFFQCQFTFLFLLKSAPFTSFYWNNVFCKIFCSKLQTLSCSNLTIYILHQHKLILVPGSLSKLLLLRDIAYFLHILALPLWSIAQRVCASFSWDVTEFLFLSTSPTRLTYWHGIQSRNFMKSPWCLKQEL